MKKKLVLTAQKQLEMSADKISIDSNTNLWSAENVAFSHYILATGLQKTHPEILPNHIQKLIKQTSEMSKHWITTEHV